MKSAMTVLASIVVAGGAVGAGGLVPFDRSAPSGYEPEAPPQSFEDAPYDSQYHFARIRYGAGGGFGGGRGFGRGRGRGGPMWAHDYPRADYNFLSILDETTYIRTGPASSNVVSLDEDDFFRHPITYMVEVGYWDPSDEEVEAMGAYLRKGGFLIVDDTRNERGFEFRNFATNMSRALPELSFQRVDNDHEIFDSFFRIDPLAVIPPYGPRNVQYWALFEDNDPDERMLVLLNLNNDIAEYWEFSDRGYYPIDLSNEAYKLGVNYVIYGMTH